MMDKTDFSPKAALHHQDHGNGDQRCPMDPRGSERSFLFYICSQPLIQGLVTLAFQCLSSIGILTLFVTFQVQNGG